MVKKALKKIACSSHGSGPLTSTSDGTVCRLETTEERVRPPAIRA